MCAWNGQAARPHRARPIAAAVRRARGVRTRGDVLRGPHPGRARPARRAAHALDRRPVRCQDAGSGEPMNSPAAEVPGADRPAAATAGAGTRRTLLTLVRREFWEHRALWIAPLATAVLLALCAIPPPVRVALGDPE